jgi:hypothetical protein
MEPTNDTHERELRAAGRRIAATLRDEVGRPGDPKPAMRKAAADLLAAAEAEREVVP